MLHGRAHHQEGDADADGDEDLDQLGHPGETPVTFINNLHGSVGRVEVGVALGWGGAGLCSGGGRGDGGGRVMVSECEDTTRKKRVV